MDRSDAELAELHADLRSRLLDKLGEDLLKQLTEDAHEAPESRSDDR